MEKIIKIYETDDYPNPEYAKHENNAYQYMAGIAIQTDKQTIFVGIDNQHQCCERFGYISSEDNYNNYIGCSIISISKTDINLDTWNLDDVLANREDINDEETNSWGHEIETIFINIETTGGTIQFTAYNLQNGAYGHDVIVVSDKFKFKETI